MITDTKEGLENLDIYKKAKSTDIYQCKILCVAISEKLSFLTT